MHHAIECSGWGLKEEYFYRQIYSVSHLSFWKRAREQADELKIRTLQCTRLKYSFPVLILTQEQK